MSRTIERCDITNNNLKRIFVQHNQNQNVSRTETKSLLFIYLIFIMCLIRFTSYIVISETLRYYTAINIILQKSEWWSIIHNLYTQEFGETSTSPWFRRHLDQFDFIRVAQCEVIVRVS